MEWSALPQRGWGFKPSATTSSAGEEDGDEEDEQGARAGVTQVRRGMFVISVCDIGGGIWCEGWLGVRITVSLFGSEHQS